MKRDQDLEKVYHILNWYHLRCYQLSKGLIPDKRKAKGVLITDAGEKALSAIQLLQKLSKKGEKKDD